MFYVLLIFCYSKKGENNPNKLTKHFIKTTNSGLKEALTTLSENVA